MTAGKPTDSLLPWLEGWHESPSASGSEPGHKVNPIGFRVQGPSQQQESLSRQPSGSILRTGHCHGGWGGGNRGFAG